MIRLLILVAGLGLLYVAAGSNFARVPMTYDCKAVEMTLGFVTVTLDHILFVVGFFLLGIAAVFNKLAQ